MNKKSAERRVADARALDKVGRRLPAATMAGIRLRAALDAALRDGLNAGDLLALADRIASSDATDGDAMLMGALDIGDLAAVKMGAATFLMVYAAAFRTVAAVMRATPTGTTEPILRAAGVVRDAAAILPDRLQELPDDDDLDAIGRRILRGHQTPADLAVVRAIPAPYLRACTVVEHWRAMVSYRND
jgi:hypothetical protein